MKFVGRTLLFVDGVELGRMPRLAICEERKTSGVLLIHCDQEWNPLGCSAHDSPQSARQKAQRIYPNIDERWVDAGVSDAEAEQYLEEAYGDIRCSVCGKRADQVTQLHQRDQKLFCDSCR